MKYLLFLLLPLIYAKLQVHIVSHTHDDTGWLKTVDQYSTGQNDTIQGACTNCILDSVVAALTKNPERKFVYVEQAFFQRWWREQTQSVRDQVKTLVSRGQLQFINGGWCMHDEATTHYMDMIDQTTLGHKFLLEEFGVTPKIGWQIDPFGHSATQAALLSAEVGFTGLFFGRIDYQDLDKRVKESKAEWIWQASESLGPTAQVFTGLTGSYHGNYGPPGGFCWDIYCSDEPIQDDPRLKGYNVVSRVEDFVQAAYWQGNHTQGSHIMMTMGSDFQYRDAENWFRNLDKLIKYVNEDGRINAFYSTPEDYVAAKAQEGITWPTKQDDLFPYADGPHQFWTGYFTSRPASKRYVRTTSSFYQAVRQADVLADPTQSRNPSIEPLAEGMGVNQHHDGNSGTAKQHVAFDYASRLSEGLAQASPVFSSSLAKILKTTGLDFQFCPLLNVSVCPPTEAAGSGVSFVIWNPLSQARRETLDVPVNVGNLIVTDGAGNKLDSQIIPSLPSVTNYGPGKGAPYTLTFQVVLPALGYSTFIIKPSSSAPKPSKLETAQPNQDVILQNEYLQLKICGSTGLLCQITNVEDKTTIDVKQEYLYYMGSQGDPSNWQASGAYIFRPQTQIPTSVSNGTVQFSYLTGPVVQEVRQVFSSWVSQRIRLAKGERHAEFTYTVGAIPIDDSKGKEVISRFTTSINNNGTFFVDSNGREMQQHWYNYRPTWPLQQTEPVAGNYYPVTTALYINDQQSQLTLLTDAPQGGSGLTGPNGNGNLELMVHRRLLNDDSRGVGEPLNETQYTVPYYQCDRQSCGQHLGPGLIVRGRHLLSLSSPSKAAARWRPLQDLLYSTPQLAFATGNLPASNGSFLINPLPPNVQVMTLEKVDTARVLLRLSHQFGIKEDPVLSKPVTVDLSNLFQGMKVIQATETSLTANQIKSKMANRGLHWKVDGGMSWSDRPWRSQPPLDWSLGTQVTLGPLEIKTFLLEVN